MILKLLPLVAFLWSLRWLHYRYKRWDVEQMHAETPGECVRIRLEWR